MPLATGCGQRSPWGGGGGASHSGTGRAAPYVGMDAKVTVEDVLLEMPKSQGGDHKTG